MKKVISIITICAALATACGRERYVEISGYAQGGTYSVKLGLPSGADANALKHGIDSILNTIDRSVNGYNKTSLLSRYNNGETVEDDGSAEYLIFDTLTRLGDSLYSATGKALDTRAAVLYDVWGFGFKNGVFPSDADIASASGNRSKMNFNAIAQGYSSDLVASYLERNGVRNMLVNIGGEMFCRGVNAIGKAWKIGIDTPEDNNDTPGEFVSAIFSAPQGVLLPDGRTSDGCGIVTSGNYRKFFIHDGVKYSHTIDPRTGYPVQHDLLSATILASNSTLADALATYCMVLGTEKAREFISSRTDIEGCLISSDSLWTSKGFKLDKNRL